jgi:hypothetical protein
MVRVGWCGSEVAYCAIVLLCYCAIESYLPTGLQQAPFLPEISLIQRQEARAGKASHYGLDDVEGLRGGVQELDAALGELHDGQEMEQGNSVD